MGWVLKKWETDTILKSYKNTNQGKHLFLFAEWPDIHVRCRQFISYLFKNFSCKYKRSSTFWYFQNMRNCYLCSGSVFKKWKMKTNFLTNFLIPQAVNFPVYYTNSSYISSLGNSWKERFDCSTVCTRLPRWKDINAQLVTNSDLFSAKKWEARSNVNPHIDMNQTRSCGLTFCYHRSRWAFEVASRLAVLKAFLQFDENKKCGPSAVKLSRSLESVRKWNCVISDEEIYDSIPQIHQTVIRC